MQRADYLVYEETPAQAYIAKLGIQGLRPSASVSNTGEMRGRLTRPMYALQRQGAMKKLVEANVQAVAHGQVALATSAAP